MCKNYKLGWSDLYPKCAFHYGGAITSIMELDMSDAGYLSTTALAKQLSKDAKEVFILLSRAHWMIKVDDRWQLTEKGKFEGGVYLQHPKYGDYVAWPAKVVGHAIWQSLPEAPLTATSLGQKLGLPARLLNLLLAELGWQSRGLKGWLLTDAGQNRGGQQHRAEQSAIPYVTWPESAIDLAELNNAVERLQNGRDADGIGIDGRIYESDGLGRLGAWLYLHNFCFASHKAIAGAPTAVSFYLPAQHLIVQLWPQVSGSGELKQKLAMQAWLKSVSHLELEADQVESISALDDILPAALLIRGIVAY